MNVDKKKVGKKISLIRLRLGLNMREFGEKLNNASDSIVSRWEKGKTLPSPERLRLIAELGGVTVENLLDTPEKFHEKFQRLRKEHNLSEKELSDMLGITEDMVVQIENNKLSFIDNSIINNAAKIFNVSISYLLDVNSDFFELDEQIKRFLNDYFFENPREELLNSSISEDDILKVYAHASKLAYKYKEYLADISSTDNKNFQERMEALCFDATASIVRNEDFTNIGSINKVLRTLDELRGDLEAYFYSLDHIDTGSFFVYSLRENADEKLYDDLKDIIDDSRTKVRLIKKYYKDKNDNK